MTLGRQVNHPFRLVFIKQRINGCSINDIHALKHIVWGTFDIAQVLEVPGIGQHIHIDDAVFAVLVYKQANDVRANKSGTAGDDNACHRFELGLVLNANLYIMCTTKIGINRKTPRRNIFLIKMILVM